MFTTLHETQFIRLTEKKLETYINEVQRLLESDKLPGVINTASCKKCAYYEYCYI